LILIFGWIPALPDSHDDLKGAIDQLTSDVRSLARRVEKLERAAGNAQGVQAPTVKEASAQPIALPEKESPWSVGGVAALMSRGAVISLVLLLALVLRTLTDSGTLGMKIGTMLGIGYATLLEAVGLLMYHRKSAFAPIFSISGALLLAAVVFETYALFGSISPPSSSRPTLFSAPYPPCPPTDSWPSPGAVWRSSAVCTGLRSR
jgi:tetrahydromethanopterin S-methyltransferase subunit B